MEKKIQARLSACGIPCGALLAEKLALYLSLLRDWNTRMDLTAVLDEEEMIDRHFADSLIVLTLPGLIPASGRLIDVGTGAGFPGLPLALACPEMQVTLLDAQQKRLDFLAAVIEAVGAPNVTPAHGRAEDAARAAAHRERYDLAVARAVAPLPVLAEYLLPFVRVGGRALCWKGPALREELSAGSRAAQTLGGRVLDPLPVSFPGRDWEHLLLPMEKTRQTPKTYPRKAGTPSRNPLGSG